MAKSVTHTDIGIEAKSPLKGELSCGIISTFAALKQRML